MHLALFRQFIYSVLCLPIVALVSSSFGCTKFVLTGDGNALELRSLPCRSVYLLTMHKYFLISFDCTTCTVGTGFLNNRRINSLFHFWHIPRYALVPEAPVKVVTDYTFGKLYMYTFGKLYMYTFGKLYMYTFGKLYMYTQGVQSKSKLQYTGIWSVRGTTSPLSPSSIVLLPLCYFAFIPIRNNSALLSKLLRFQYFSFT
jgi:hypothetical protein